MPAIGWSEGVHVDAVLGLSMTPTSLGVVVVDSEGAPVGSGGPESFELRVDRSDVRAATAQATAAAGAIAAARGHRLTSIGVTWSDGADAEASALIDSLGREGFDNVVPIRLPEATEALARGMAEVIGYRTSAVCVIEPDTAIALIVNIDDGAVQTAVNHGLDGGDSLIGWLSTVFARADWQPEALVMVGSAGGFEAALPGLEEALSVPVFAPAEAPLALARGAALASTPSAGLPFSMEQAGIAGDAAQRRSWTAPRVLTGLLVAGVVTFVISTSVAVAMEAAPRPEAAAPEPVAIVQDAPRGAVGSPTPGSAPAEPEPEPAEPIAETRSPLAEALTPPVEFVPVPEAAPVEPAEQAPIQEANTVNDTIAVEVPVQEPALAPLPVPAPPVAVPPAAVAPPPVPPVYSQPYEEPKKPLLQRIRDRLRIGGPEQGPPGQIVVSPPQG